MSCVTDENDFSWDSDCQSLLGGTCFLLRGYVNSASCLPLAAVVHVVLGRKYERLYLRVEISNGKERMGDLRCGEDLLPLVTVAQLFPPSLSNSVLRSLLEMGLPGRGQSRNGSGADLWSGVWLRKI